MHAGESLRPAARSPAARKSPRLRATWHLCYRRCAHAEDNAAAARHANKELSTTLEHVRADAEAARQEAELLRQQLAKQQPARKNSPKPDSRVIDRRPVRLRGTLDADAEANAAKAEARKAKREEHFKQLEVRLRAPAIGASLAVRAVSRATTGAARLRDRTAP